MSYKDKIKKIIESVDVGEPVFTITVDNKGRRLSVREEDWEADLPQDEMYSNLISHRLYRSYDSYSRKYNINCSDEIIGSTKSHVYSGISRIFINTSPFDQPKRTNIYKSFIETVEREFFNNEEFCNQIFDIFEYHWKVTQTDSITNESNDVHRKNIYNLLCLMEKRYGKSSK